MASGTRTRQGQSAKNLSGSKGSSSTSKRSGGDQGAKRGAAAAGKKAR